MLAPQHRSAAGPAAARVALGAQLFVWARLAYFGLYLAGIPLRRAVAWGVGVAGLAMILSVLLV